MNDIGACAGTRMTFDLFVLGEHRTPDTARLRWQESHCRACLDTPPVPTPSWVPCVPCLPFPTRFPWLLALVGRWSIDGVYPLSSSPAFSTSPPSALDYPSSSLLILAAIGPTISLRAEGRVCDGRSPSSSALLGPTRWNWRSLAIGADEEGRHQRWERERWGGCFWLASKARSIAASTVRLISPSSTTSSPGFVKSPTPCRLSDSEAYFLDSFCLAGWSVEGFRSRSSFCVRSFDLEHHYGSIHNRKMRWTTRYCDHSVSYDRVRRYSTTVRGWEGWEG